MAMISNDWLPALKDEFRKPYYAKLFSFVKEEYATHVVYPPADDIFNAFHFTPLREVKVVRRCRRRLSIFIRSCMMIWDAIFQTTVIWKNGRSRAC